MPAPEIVHQLVKRFEENLDSYRSSRYNETQLRREFLDPLFEALGWDVFNKQGYAEPYKDVIHEDSLEVEGATKAPDYAFRIGGGRKFFVEAKKPSVKIETDIHPAFQLRRYSWSAKLPIGVLSDFEEFAIYETRSKPDKKDKASTGRVAFYTFTEYVEKWDEIANIFSREAVLKGSFDKFAEGVKKKKGTAEVDDAFLAEIERWRELLARNFALRNESLSTRELNFLGFHLEWKLPKDQKPWLRVTPTQKSIERFKRTIKEQTRRSTLYQPPLEKVQGLNRVMRGWNQYYEYVNATQDASKLTFWANGRLFLWLKKRHKKGARWVIQHYRQREKKGSSNRWNLGVKDESGQTVFLYQMTDLHRKIYYARKRPHPYLIETENDTFPDDAFPLYWEGKTTPEKAAWAEIRLAVLQRDGYHCTECGNSNHLHAHHIRPVRKGGAAQMDNLKTLCKDCHAKTPSWGRPKGTTGSTQSRRAG
jgi:5-methylcytosine-specific restriction endonuclease McrA